MTEYLFVYGTLRKDSSQPMAKLLVENSRFLGTASTQGALYDLGRYPGMVISDNPDHVTHGELFELTDPQNVLGPLDDYEECSDNFPKPTLYERKICSVLLEDGNRIEAWTYIYNRKVEGHFFVREGDYMAHLATKGATGQVFRFMESDWQAFRKIRLQALVTNPEVYCSSFAREEAFEDDYWKGYLKENTAVFCLGHTDDPIGMAGIYIEEGIGQIWGVWIDPERRQAGQSKLLVQACKNWAEHHPDITGIAASARQSNEASIRMLKSIGMTIKDTTENVWSDGQSEPMVNLTADLND